MSFVKSLLGGVAIMVAATLIGVAQNAVRSNPLNLFPKVQTPKPTTPSPVNPATDAAPAAEPSLAGAVATNEVTADEIARGELSRERLRAVMEAGTAIIIDARGKSDYAEGHVRGALNIPYEGFAEHYTEVKTYLEAYVPMDAAIVCYCEGLTCDFSDHLAQELRLMGYEKVVLFRGGWEQWSEAGFPSEVGESTLEGEREE